MRASEQNERTLRLWQHAAVFALACVVLISRRPDAVFHAQFWAEDGHTWYADAYNFGWWRALFFPLNGYYQTVPRIGAALALLAPLAWAPLVMNALALVFQALPVNILLSARSSGWGSLRFRALMAAVYLALPNCYEISLGITDTQWLLALCAFLLIVARPPATGGERVFDVVVLALSGLTGPFCLLLLPASALVTWRSGYERGRVLQTAALAATALAQLLDLLLLDHGRAQLHGPLGAGLAMLLRILGGDVYLGALLGDNVMASLPSHAVGVWLALAACAGTLLAAVAVAKAPVRFKLLAGFSALLLAVSLISPVAWPDPHKTAWQILVSAPGMRYWYFPTLSFAWLLLWCAWRGATPLRAIAVPLLCVMCVGMVRDWRHAPFQDVQFAEAAAQFDAAPRGTAMIFPENPTGWEMRLVKH